MKAIIIGPPLVGKSTLVNYLRGATSFIVLELDEEILKRNMGSWPYNDEVRNTLMHEVLETIIKKVVQKNSLVFFSTYVAVQDLENARQHGFKIIQLVASKQILLERDKERLKAGSPDSARYIEENFKYQKTVKERGLVDYTIDMEEKLELSSQRLIEYLNNI
jgi:dephospho-CoA kinase